MAVDLQGRIHVADWRYLRDGRVDSSYKPDAQDRVLAARASRGKALNVRRVSADGRPDRTFARDSTANVPITGGKGIRLEDLVAEPTGRSYLAYGSRSRERGFRIVALNDHGRLDRRFGHRGRLYTPIRNATVADLELDYPTRLLAIAGFNWATRNPPLVAYTLR
jgi:hypothetical protein